MRPGTTSAVILAPPPGYAVSASLRDITLCHPLLQSRWAAFRAAVQYTLFVNETYRYDARQQYLFGGGRSAHNCIAHGVPAAYARPNDPIVTNAWSASTSAHGWTLVDGIGRLMPASAAIDVVPVGPDGKPWTKDDPWDDFVVHCETIANGLGLRHFRNAAGCVVDRPHLQLQEWSDLHHALILPDPPVPPTATLAAA